MHEDVERCVRAVSSRDARFDGWFFTCVVSTGIYCRPSCPARTPKPENMRFCATAAAAQREGFRACKRCQPDAVPGSPRWNGRADVVARAVRLIGEGLVDREGVPGLASRLGYSVRQVERLVQAELGVGPLALARAQRAQTARLLIESSGMPLGEVAFAAGFASVRSFNATVASVFGMTPGALRERARGGVGYSPGRLLVRLPFRGPLHVEGLWGHLVATAVPGVEEWSGGVLRRSLRLPFGTGVVGLRRGDGVVWCELSLSDMRDVSAAISRCRWLLDLDADPVAVDEVLSHDEVLRPLVAAAGGRRVPRSVDPAEFVVRAVIGQQVSTAAARTVAGRLVEEFGEPVVDVGGGVSRLFPSMEVLAGVDPAALPMPGSRGRALVAVADALASGAVDVGVGSDWGAVRAGLSAVRGIGPWTVEMVMMRGVGDPDAFVPGDLWVRAGAERLGLPTAVSGLVEWSSRWRPWRAYAVQHLWALGDHEANRLPDLSGSSPAVVEGSA
ncbi:AlkA N-terminal domain-containing protein [Stackebrandtia soli]|uniref:AlkA N-terminal domain-containing protein n=1 Tax=Stackebrandtia soli TaxID=1892856 RepID=UPI0039ED6CD4